MSSTVKIDFCELALEFRSFGINPIPVDEFKRPVKNARGKRTSWTYAQGDLLTASDVQNNSNWKLAKGAAAVSGVNNLVCLDFDDQGDRNSVDTALEILDLPLDYEWLIATGSGRGYHILIFCPDYAGENKTVADGLLSGQVEMRHKGHYSLLPPSAHETGNRYRWANGQDMPQNPPASESWEVLESTFRAITRKTEPTAATSSENTISRDWTGLQIDPYYLTALEREAATVSTAIEGSRNDALNEAALKIGHYVGAGKLPRSLAEDLLTGAARTAGLPENEIRATLKSGLDAGIREPKTKPDTPPAPSSNGNGRYPADSKPSRASSVVPPHTDDREGTTEIAPAPRFKLIPEAALEDQKPLEWLVKDYIPRGGLSMLYGPSGSAKSFAGLDMSLRIGQAESVVYVASEGQAGYPKRRAAWYQHYKNAKPGKVHFLYDTVPLMNAQAIDEFIKTIWELKPALVVLDTFAYAMSGGDENSARDTQIAIANCQKIIRETGTAILLIHHTGKSGASERGSSALRGAADVMIEISNHDGYVTIECSKTKDEAPFETRHFQLMTVTTAKGESCVMIPAEKMAADPDTLTPSEQKILNMLSMETFIEAGAKVAVIQDEARIPKSSIYRLLSSLMQRDMVHQGAKGEPYTITISGLIAIGKNGKGEVKNS